MFHYHTRFSKIDALCSGERAAMAGLYLRHYDACDEARFFVDLEEKSEVLLLYCGDMLVGFSTFLLYPFLWREKTVRIVFSGDTVVERMHWGQQRLAFDWIARMGRLFREAPEIPLYWFLIVKGHRTFRYLPAFSKRFFPHWHERESSLCDLRDLAAALAHARFGADYDAAAGVVAFADSHGHLKPEIAWPDETEMRKEAVRFFLERNEGYRRGHELVCVCPLHEDNLKPLSRRIFLGARDE